jgi:hypothetical protein
MKLMRILLFRLGFCSNFIGRYRQLKNTSSPQPILHKPQNRRFVEKGCPLWLSEVDGQLFQAKCGWFSTFWPPFLYDGPILAIVEKGTGGYEVV